MRKRGGREREGGEGERERKGGRKELLGSLLVPRAKANASYGTAKSSKPRLRLKRFMRRTVKEFAISRSYTRRHKGRRFSSAGYRIKINT